MIKKILIWLGIAFVGFFIVTNPGGAADVFEAIGDGLAYVGRQIGKFFVELTN